MYIANGHLNRFIHHLERDKTLTPALMEMTGEVFEAFWAWQLRTPFCFKVPGARVSSPQIGGVIIRSVDGYLFTIPFVKHIARDEPE